MYFLLIPMELVFSQEHSWECSSVWYVYLCGCVLLVFIIFTFSVQFSSVAQLCPTLCDPMDYRMSGFPVHHQLPELAQTHVHRQNMVHWRREWQTTSVFLPWEPHEQYEKAKRFIFSVDIYYVPGPLVFRSTADSAKFVCPCCHLLMGSTSQ